MVANNNNSAQAPRGAGAEPHSAGARRTKVIIVGAGDELLMEVGPALSDRYHSYSVDTAAEIGGLSASSWIGVFDAGNGAGGRRTFAQLESQYPQQPWIVVCADDDRPNWRDVLTRGGACVVIARSELSVATFAAALEKAMQRLTANPRAAATATQSTPIVPLLWILGAAVLVVAAGATWWMTHSRRRPPPTAVPNSQYLPAASAPAQRLPALEPAGRRAATQGVEVLLSLARVAFRDPAAQLPKADAALQGTSALELYGAVLVQQPTNKEALDGVRRLQAVARLRVQDAVAAGDADTAARLLAVLQHANFAPEALHTLQASVAAIQVNQLTIQARSALAAGNLPVARARIDQLLALQGERAPVPELRKALAARRLEGDLAAAAQRVRAALATGALLEPANDNARTRLLVMRELSRTSPQTLAVQHELLLALLRRAQVAMGRQDLDGASQTLTIAQEFGSKAELAETRAGLDAALSARRVAEAAAAAAKAARAGAPGSDAKAGAEPILSPKPTRPMQVDFPPAALAANIQGYVVVEFMLNLNGGAAAATVVESSPPRTFDNAALAAIKRATFSTKDLADAKKPQRARFRINFTLADNAAPAAVSRAARAAAPAARGAAASSPLQILSPKPTQSLQVDYPKVALALHRTGYVVVEFMLQPDGTPGSPMVIESAPEKVFDYEALMAVKRARFVTSGLADPNQAQRARVKINFKGQ